MKLDNSAMKSMVLAGVLALVACGGSEKEPAKDEVEKTKAAATDTKADATAPAAASGSTITLNVAGEKAPTDEQVKKDIAGDAKGILSIDLDKEPGKKAWNDANSQYFWEKGATITREGETAGTKLKVMGYARYEITGLTYNYREFKVTDNKTEGLARPTDAEALAFVKQHLTDEILAGKSGSVVNGDKIEISILQGDAQKWEVEPKTASFKIAIKYDMIKSNTEIESRDSTMTVKIFKDEPAGPWLRAISMGDEEVKTSSVKKYTDAEIRAMPTGIPGGAPRPGGR